MRDIKFRAINRYTKDWCYGSLVKYYEDYHIQEPEQYEFMDIIEETIGQYTGLKDKNGKEIYEGDIVQIDDDYELYGLYAGELYQVYYGFSAYRIKPKYASEKHGCCLDDAEGMTIIGNIYDNPELVKEIENQKNI